MTARHVSSAILLFITAALVSPVRAQIAVSGELRVMRADYFENYAGSFLSIEVFDDQVSPDGSSGPFVSVAWRSASGTYGTAVDVPRYIDSVPTPHVYLYNRMLLRVGPASGAADVPVSIRVTSSTGAEVEASVRPWLAATPPPHVAGYRTEFFTHYLDPTEVRADLDALGARYPQLISVTDVPFRSSGYSRKAATAMGAPDAFGGVAYAGQTGNLASGAEQRAVIIESLADGHDGGNNIFVTFRNPGAANAPLTVSVAGNELTVDLATDAAAALTSTAAQVTDAINANPAAAAMVTASRYRNNAGTGIVRATPRSQLSDWLSAPASVQRGPFQNHLIRIGAHRDGSKVGVFVYCQQHGNNMVTPLTCVEAAHRLAENYATDPETKLLLDNVEVFMLPTVNPDGAHYAMYDNSMQRKTLANRCAPNTFQDPMARDSVGVNLDRNNAVGSIFDGYVGASVACTSSVFAGPFEVSEPESKNLHWIVGTFPNIKFSLNVQSAGGYFMWSPGAYQSAGRVTLPQPNRGLEQFHFAVGESVLSRVKGVRNTAVLPARVGAMSDVRMSEAGNSADDQWFLQGVFAYTLAIGADRFDSMTDGTDRTAVGVMPAFPSEGHDEAIEFAEGIFGLVRAAYDYAVDTTAPSVDMVPNGGAGSTSISATFADTSEPATIYYTLDGSTPTLASPAWDAGRPRTPGPSFLFTESTTVKWIAQDIKGNLSAVRTAEFLIDTTPPVTTAMVSPAGVDGWNVSATITLTADDGAGSGVDFIQYRLDGGAWTTYSGPFVVTGDGVHALEYHASDLLGNVEAISSLAVRIDATEPAIAITTPAAGAVYMAGASVPAAYSCSDDTSGVALCNGSAAVGASIDTATVGAHTFAVNAQDNAGNTRQVTVSYQVIAAHSPFSMRGNGSVPGSNPQGVDFDFSASDDGVSASGSVQAKVKLTGPQSGQGDQFDASTVDQVIFSNDPNYTPGANANGVIDTVSLSGTGLWNGQAGYHYTVTASDRGEPGRNHDTFTIEVTAPNGSVVFTAGGTLTKGNVQSTQ